MTRADEHARREADHLQDELYQARAKIEDQERALSAAYALAAAVQTGSAGLMHYSLEDYIAAREDTL